jgi:hypothetical protein
MSAKDAHRQQKRQAKLAKRTRKERDRKRVSAEPQPYSGRKYHTDRWVPHVYQTELAIYEGIMLSGRQLTNDQVRRVVAENLPEFVFTWLARNRKRRSRNS